jgi:hypothetical protein
MRRAILGTALALIASASIGVATAAAKTETFNGDAGPGTSVSFGAKLKHGKVVKVSAFTWDQVPMSCATEDTVIDEDFGVDVKVKKKKFQGSDVGVPGGTLNDVFSGRFTSKTQASGTLRTFGDYPGFGSCDTGTVPWTASRH